MKLHKHTNLGDGAKAVRDFREGGLEVKVAREADVFLFKCPSTATTHIRENQHQNAITH